MNKITELLRISKQLIIKSIFRKIRKLPAEFGKIFMKLCLPKTVSKTVAYQP